MEGGGGGDGGRERGGSCSCLHILTIPTHPNSIPALLCLTLHTSFLMDVFMHLCSGSKLSLLRIVVITHLKFWSGEADTLNNAHHPTILGIHVPLPHLYT